MNKFKLVENEIGLVGVLMQPFFSSGKGLFWLERNTGMWIHLGINCLSVFAIILWAGIHSFIIFGTLQYFGMLRIDLDTELQGSDITKHGEDAYQVNDWMRPNSDISTQTMNYEESSTRLDVFPKCPRKGNPKMLQTLQFKNERDLVIMDNFQTILKSCKI